MDKRGKFIVIDGMDGSGKGTQIKLLQEKLAGHNVLFTREPGGSPKAEEIRKMILQSGGPASNAVCDFFLFFAARGSHIQDVVAPARTAGTHVICDRYDSSTFAFQLRGEQSDLWLEQMFEAVRHMLPSDRYWPDAYIVLDLPAEVAFERRAKDVAQQKDRFDIKPLEYHQRVQAGFRQFAKLYGPVRFVDAQRTPQEVHTDVLELVSHELGL